MTTRMSRSTAFIASVVAGALVLALVVKTASAGVAQDGLTEVEQVRLENLALKQQLIAEQWRADACVGRWAEAARSQNHAALEAEMAGLKQRIEAGHPGYTWDWKAGLVPAPAPLRP